MRIISLILHRSLAIQHKLHVYIIYIKFIRRPNISIAPVAWKCNTSYMLLTCVTSF